MVRSDFGALDLDTALVANPEAESEPQPRVRNIRALMAPTSIAVVGASNRPGSIGVAVIQSLSRLGFAGDVWAVNPKNTEVLGIPCYPSLGDLPKSPDLVTMVVRGSTIPDHLDALETVGAKAAVIYDGGFAEAGDEGNQLQHQIATFCANKGIALCGPNCMGIISPYDASTSYKLPVVDHNRLKGNVGVISQSGSITIGLLADVRRYGFSHIISSGNEAVVDASDYLEYLIDDSHTSIIALFLESVRSPARFLATLRRALAAGKPVVVLKVGRSERAKRAVATHTGALAGEADIFSAALRSVNAIEVRDIDEMSEVLAAFQVPHRLSGGRTGVATLSGGHSELILDLAESAGVDLPSLSSPEMKEIQRVVGHVSGDGNPIDVWGNGDTRVNFDHTTSVLSKYPGFDALVLCYDQNEAPVIESQGTAVTMFAEAAKKSTKPFYVLNMRSGLMRNSSVELLRNSGAGVLTGARQGLEAIHRLGTYETRRSVKKQAPNRRGVAPSVLGGETRRAINEFDSKSILSKFGVPVPDEELHQELEQALIAAERIGWPVVLKAISDEVLHKTEYGFVKLNIRGPDELRTAWTDLTNGFAVNIPAKRLNGILVQKMVSGGVEVFAGLSRDPEWGLALAFGLGGIFIEVIHDVALRLLPLSADDAAEMILETKAAKILAGARGLPPADIKALAGCLQALARFGENAESELAGCDVNPIKVLPEGLGCVALDALITLNRN
jgi:acyl-CoA synthetase (NDP forming)